MRQTDYTTHEKNMKKKWNTAFTKPSTNTRINLPLLRMRLMRTQETLATIFDCKSIVATVISISFFMTSMSNSISSQSCREILLIIRLTV